MHVFDTRPELMAAIRVTFEQLGEAGLGPGRGRAALSRVQRMGADESAWEMRTEPGPPVVISLDPDPAEQAVRQVRLQFLTPTELKGGKGGAGWTARSSACSSPGCGIAFQRFGRFTAPGRWQSISVLSADARER